MYVRVSPQLVILLLKIYLTLDLDYMIALRVFVCLTTMTYARSTIEYHSIISIDRLVTARLLAYQFTREYLQEIHV